MELRKYESIETIVGQAGIVKIIIYPANVVFQQPPKINYIIGEKSVKWKITVEELPEESK